ncbi:DUF58 domain-containing protein [Pontibacter akesuensis]|uniref:Uncharacterized conserved protein, DUF58 family, contains vWF domain n=1 Tax=Pontibacter akesuensis TaxID=388950 RepID=A0A1I7GPJ6_9BACT|nr:DUF58 domain-containing protein [Pontibacter akesuensis]GHA55765.1 hypothetical protein GCM10007389_04140 [Pontibacter akesuensis]SFU50146.1 Uncharacterized conserved protein, DUF58 family, contains vWF domain [Pontibacter akesuensis]
MQFIRSLYFTNRFYLTLAGLVCLFVLAFFLPLLLILAKVAFSVLVLLTLADLLLLYSNRSGFFASRSMQEKLSNGSDNDVYLYLENKYNFAVQTEVIDELPFQFQQRDSLFTAAVGKGRTQIIHYTVRPTKRGSYQFGAINVYAMSALQLIKRRYRFAQDQEVPVYPSFMQMRQYELLAISNRLQEFGMKKVRRIGHSSEFEQIRPYVAGDDQRTINWKASARKAELMVNSYQDEKSQQVYCLIDKGRVMQMPFAGLSLLDYAINAALVISNIALKKQDKAGIITFSNKISNLLPAQRKADQLRRILELLYNQKTKFQETDYERLYATVRSKIKQRSLLLLFTNFETLSGAERQLPYLRALAKHHLLVVIFFENTELHALLHQRARTTEEAYTKAIAQKFDYDKRQIVKQLQQHGIHAILTPPEQLTVNTINKYLELKARGLI